MKKAALLGLCALITLASTAQVNMTLGLGAAKNETLTHPALLFEVGYQLPLFTLSAGYATNLSRRSDAGTLFFAKFGKEIPVSSSGSLYAAPSLGYGFLLRSVDVKGANHKLPVLGLEMGLQTGLPQAKLFAAGIVTSKVQFFTLGCRFLVLRTEERYCR